MVPDLRFSVSPEVDNRGVSKINVLTLSEQIPDEASAYEYLESLRWNGIPECPHCGNVERCYFLTPKNGTRSTSTGAATQRRLWKCAACRKKFSVLTNTVMHGTKIPEQVPQGIEDVLPRWLGKKLAYYAELQHPGTKPSYVDYSYTRLDDFRADMLLGGSDLAEQTKTGTVPAAFHLPENRPGLPRLNMPGAHLHSLWPPGPRFQWPSDEARIPRAAAPEETP